MPDRGVLCIVRKLAKNKNYKSYVLLASVRTTQRTPLLRMLTHLLLTRMRKMQGHTFGRLFVQTLPSLSPFCDYPAIATTYLFCIDVSACQHALV